MLWKNRRESTNVEDRRGITGGHVALGGGATLVVIVLSLLFGADPLKVLSDLQGGPGGTTTNSPLGSGDASQPVDPAQEETKHFVSVVLADTEDVWTEQFQQLGKQYQDPKLVLFTGQVDSACGYASAAVGPFYCSADQQVYLDLSFLDELKTRFHVPGDFPGAYVIAHEVGHHVQDLLGTTDKVNAMRAHLSQKEQNALSVRVELQADFYAGVWAHFAQQTKGVLEPGDIEEALTAATAIGDDKLQEEAQGRVVPDSFTHGTSAQRVRWFKKGYETGDMSQGDTFSAKSL